MVPWSTAELVARLKAKGLTAAEAVLKTVAAETIDWAAESLMASTSTVAKIAAPMVAGMKPVLLGEIDKLDGVQGN